MLDYFRNVFAGFFVQSEHKKLLNFASYHLEPTATEYELACYYENSVTFVNKPPKDSSKVQSYLESKVLAMKAKPVRDDGKKMKPKRKKKLFDLYKVMKQIHPVTGVSCVKPCSL